MDDIDLSSKFLRGKPINLGLFQLCPLTLDQIFDDVGFSEYNRYLSILCIDSDSIKEMLDIKDETIIEPFEYLYVSAFQQEESKKIICEALHTFLKEDIYFGEGFFQIGKKVESIISQNNFNYFIEILKQQNCINVEKEKIIIENDAQKKFTAPVKEDKREIC